MKLLQAYRWIAVIKAFRLMGNISPDLAESFGKLAGLTIENRRTLRSIELESPFG